MKTENTRSYNSTRFTVLTDEENNTSTRKNYFICVIIGAAFVCITAAYFSYKSFISPTYFNDENSLFSSSGITDHPKYSEWKLYNPKPVLAGLRRETSKDHRELTCEESQPRSEAIPAIFIREILEKNFENVHDYVNLDLLVHYENIINTYGAASLKTIFNEYQFQLSSVNTSTDFLNFLTVLKSNKFNFYADYLKENCLHLKHFEGFFALTVELNHWYNYLSGLNVFLSQYAQQKMRNYVMNCTKTNFEKFTENTQKRIFHLVYPFNITDKKIQEVNEVINSWAKSVNIVSDNTTIVFYGKILLVSELNREIRRLNISCLKAVFILAGHTVFLDDDMELFGVDLAIISPDWVFLKKIIINLNGLDGRYTTKDAGFGEAGKPGNPGRNAGDFFGVGNLNEELLFVTVNGGKGGNGQNGAKGRIGANNTLPDPPVDKPGCTTKVKTFKNAFGQMITQYKIYNHLGCGGSGTDGGVGGQGGAGGVITLISGNSMKVETGLNGTAGSPGKGGAGGPGGRDGCFYEVLDIDDEVLHRVTRVKCVGGNTLPAGEFGKDNHNTQGQIIPPMKENMKLHRPFYLFLQYTDGDLSSGTISILKQLNQLDVHTPPDINDILLEFKLLEEFDNIEFYEVFVDRINKYIQQLPHQPVLKYIRSIILGRITALKTNINYLFIDLKKYLNMIKTDIKNANELTRQFQSSIYLKEKIEIKREEIKQNMDKIKFRLTRRSHKNRINCVMIRTINVLQILLTQTWNAIRTGSNVPFRSCSLNLKTDAVNNREILTDTSLTNLLRILENAPSKEDIRGHLEKLKGALCIAKDSDVLSEEEKTLLEALTDEVEHFMALYYFVDWEELENSFLKSLPDLTLDTASELEQKDVEFLKGQLNDVIISVPFSLAMGTARHSLYPSSNKSVRVRFFQNKSLKEDSLTEITLMEEKAYQRIPSFCRNHLKAVFDKNSITGEFYFWPNANIRNKLRILFSGAEIDLKANLINRHVFDKNFVQFTSLKLELECSRNGNLCQEELDGVLDNFKLEMTHSGYSYYNWREETQIVVSEKVNLEYSFRMGVEKEPEIYNALYNKCQNGEIKLSPFTTWSLRLLPINEEADFKKLLSFAEAVNLRLTGSGTYFA